MKVITTVDSFQQEISILFNNIPFIKVYLDDILIVSYQNVSDYLNKLSQVLQNYYKPT